MTEHRVRYFYLAGSYAKRVENKAIAAELEEMAGWRGWKCNARWLEGKHDDAEAELCAIEDLEDVMAAEALVLVHGQSTLGGMWVEMGMAIAHSKPVFIYIPLGEEDRALPVFGHLPNIRVTSLLIFVGKGLEAMTYEFDK